jgi:uncharacterized protein (DUF488 family)
MTAEPEPTPTSATDAENAAGRTSAGESELPQFLTIGHSNRELNEFIELLTDTGTEVVVDVRKLPGSNRNPQFNADTLGADLADSAIELRRLEGLTGRRPVSRTVPFEVNAWWQNRSFHNYADHCLSEEFRTDLATLIDWAETARLALMCSEAVWWRCHRRIIADQLLGNGHEVSNVLGPGHIDPAKLSDGARLGSDQNADPDTAPGTIGIITYPAATAES